MNAKRYAVLISFLLVSGCIVGDQLTTLTIHPDGSADLVVFRANLHSTQKGEPGEKELGNYKANFAGRIDDEFVRIRQAGGEVTEASWVSEQAPLSNLVRAHFASASSLEKFGTVTSADRSLRIRTKFHSDGMHRRLSVHVAVSPEKRSTFESVRLDEEQLRQAYADGISETRIAVTGGFITASRGFTVAGDKQSALLDMAEISEVLRMEPGESEFYLEWDLTL